MVRLDTVGSNYDTVLSVYSGVCGSLTPVACNDDTDGIMSEVTWLAQAGVPYLIEVTRLNNTSQPGNCLTLRAVGLTPPNDHCSGATPLFGTQGSVTVNVDEAGTDPDEPAPCATPWAASVWFTYTPATNGTLYLSSKNSTYNTILQVLIGTCGSLVPYACNDDSAGAGQQAELAIQVDSGHTYYIQAAAFVGEGWVGGDLHLSYYLGAPCMSISQARSLPLGSDVTLCDVYTTVVAPNGTFLRSSDRSAGMVMLGEMYVVGTGLTVSGRTYLDNSFTVYEDSMRLANSASLDHFYNPEEPNINLGLNLQGWNALEKAGNWGKAISLLVTCLAGIPGLADVSGDVSPDFPNRGGSAVALCQQKYDKAVAADKTGLYSDAMFDLGWACHALADLSVVQHTYDSWITHEKYEDAADYKGNDPQFHAKTARPWSSPVVNYPEDLYGFVKSGGTPSQLAVRTAQYVHSLQQFKWAEGANATPGGVLNEIARWASDNGGPTDFNQALIRALPVAERHTTALISRFMLDTGVPEQVPLVVGIVMDTSNRPVPGAYVFYCSRPDSNSYHTPWAYIRADSSGRFAFNFRPQFQYLIHAAMPGYTYKLQGRYIYNTPAGMQVQVLGPDASAWFIQKGGKVSNQIELVLEPLPKFASLNQPPATAVSKVRPTRPVAGATVGPQPQPKMATGVSQAVIAGPQALAVLPNLGNLQMRLKMEQAAPTAMAAGVVKPNSPLPLSKRTLSREMAECLNEVMLDVKAVRKGLQYNALGQAIPGEPLQDMKAEVAVPMNDRDADRPYVLLQVSHIVGIAKGDILRTPEEVLHAVDLAHSAAQSQPIAQVGPERPTADTPTAVAPTGPTAAAGRERTRPIRGVEQTRPVGGPGTAQAPVTSGANSPQAKALKLLASKLPQATVTLANGKQAKIVRLPSSSAGYSGRTSLLANGMAPVPAQAGVKIEVRIVEAPGFLGPKPPGTPLMLTTDACGRAAFQLGPGGYPGRIRLLIRVVQDGEVAYRPQTSLDFFVNPYGPADPVEATLPWLHEAAVVNL